MAGSFGQWKRQNCIVGDFSYSIDTENHLTIINISGTISYELAERMVRELAADPAFDAKNRTLIDAKRVAWESSVGELQEMGARLLKRLPVYFDQEQPAASLLHGDLWGGNWACCDGRPVIFDPAVYYGDRETDLAMTRLFGGFGRNFYEAYEAAWPLRDGHLERQHLLGCTRAQHIDVINVGRTRDHRGRSLCRSQVCARA